MLNQTVIVGRLTRDPEVKELEDGKKVSNLCIAVPRSYKNAEGVYDTDFVDCTLWNNIAEQTTSYCKKGDIVGIKGRLETSNFEKDGENRKAMSLIAEKVTFLSSNSKDKEKESEKDSEIEV